MKRPWDQVKLRVLWHTGAVPVEGDELRTVRGRRYLILSITEKQITALVLPKDEPEPAPSHLFLWTWGARKK